jgi:hypothetical protein
MNYDPIFYHTLTPLVLSYKLHAGTIFAAAFIFHWVRGSWYGSNGDFKAGSEFWKSSILSLLVYTICFVPVPNPGELIGFQDSDVDISQTQFQQTTVAIFLIERLSYGTDSLAKSIISWDISIKAQEHLSEEYVSGPSAVVQTSRTPNDSEIIYNFIILRAQFLNKIMKNMWNNEDLKSKGVTQEGDEDETLGTWELMKSLSSGQIVEYLSKQISAFLYNLSSALGMLAAFLILLIISFVLYLLAGLVKFAAVFVTGIVLFILPFAWFINGRKTLSVAFNLVVVYIPLKAVIVITVWLTFFMIEAIQLQGYREVATDYPIFTETLDQFEPGFMYTEAGSDILFVSETVMQLQRSAIVASKTLLSIIICLLCMVYIIIKAPSLISAMLGIQSMTDDLFTSIVFVAGAAASGGAALKAKLLKDRASSAGNAVIPTSATPEPASRHG